MKSETTLQSAPEYHESELTTAAFLLAKNFQLLGLKEVAPNRFVFRFVEDADGSTQQAALSYLSGATIVAKDFASAERSLKSLLYSRPNHGLGQRNFNSNKKVNTNVSTERY
jgi:hypothetical protein